MIAAAPAETLEPAKPADPPPVRRDTSRLLWASPTSGEPIDPRLIPEGSELLVYARPQALLATEEGRRVWKGLGPGGDAAQSLIEEQTGKELAQIDRLMAGAQPGESYESVAWLFSTDAAGDEEPLMRREVEQLLETSDADRHVTLIFTPAFLLGDGGSILSGAMSPVRDALLAVARDEWRGAALSLHVGERLFWELRVVGDRSAPPVSTARTLDEEAKRWAESLRSVAPETGYSEHTEQLLSQLPTMIELLGKRTRKGVAQKQAVINGYLPIHAAHNLMLSFELLLQEIQAPGVGTAPLAAADEESRTLQEKLQKPVTLVFARESLESAVSLLSNAMGVPITIVGRDLQLEGITRNQMLGLELRDRPASEALVEIVRRANPDTEATGPTDARQKLVYVVDQTNQSIVITTRAAAAARGDTLPDPFTP